MLFASYLLLGRNKCEIMLAMDCEYEAAKCRSEFLHSIEKRVTRQTNKQGNTDSNIGPNHVQGLASGTSDIV